MITPGLLLSFKQKFPDLMVGTDLILRGRGTKKIRFFAELSG